MTSRFAHAIQTTVLISVLPLWSLCGSARAEDLPASTAENLSGAELWRWRERMHRAALENRLEELAAIVRSLVGDHPAEHYLRAAIALDAERLRNADIDSRRAFPAHWIELDFADRPPFDPRLVSGWVRERLPYVDSGILAQCASRALARGRVREAVDWYLCAIETTAACEDPFFAVLNGLVQCALRSETSLRDLQSELESITGCIWPRRDDVRWLAERLAILAHYADPERSAEACRELLERCSGDRLLLAIAERRAVLSAESPWSRTEQRNDHAALLPFAVHPLDRATLLQREASRAWQSEQTRAAGLDLLDRARQLAPPSPRAQRIHGELLLQRARYGEDDQAFVDCLRDALSRHRHYGEGLLPAVDSALVELASRSRVDLLAQCCAQLLEWLPEDHAFRARVYFELAEREPEHAEAELWLERCAGVRSIGLRTTEPAQALALRALAVRYAARGEFARAAEAHAHAITLVPPPEPLEVEAFAPVAQWLAWRSVNEALDPLFADLVLLLKDGAAVGRNQEDRILALLLRPLLATYGSDAVARRVIEHREWCSANNGRPGVFEFWTRVHEVAEFDAALLDRIERAFEAPTRISDTDAYDLALAALDSGSALLAVRVLARARQQSTDNSADRFATVPPEPLLNALRARVQEGARDFEVETAAALLGPHPDVRNREALLTALPLSGPSVRPVLLHALKLQPTPKEAPLTPHEQRAVAPLFEQLANGELVSMELCLALDEHAAEAAIEDWCAHSPSRVHRAAALTALLRVSPAVTARVLAGLMQRPEVHLQCNALELCARFAGELSSEERLSVLGPGLDSQESELRVYALEAITAAPLLAPQAVTARIVDLFGDSSPAVCSAARDSLARVEGVSAGRQIVLCALDTPALLDDSSVREALIRLAPGPPPEGNGSPAQREQALRELLQRFAPADNTSSVFSTKN